MTPGMRAAIDAADADGWIVPPRYRSLGSPPRTFKSADLNRLDEAGLIRARRRRVDGIHDRRLTPAGEALR